MVLSLTWALECDRPQRRRSVLLQVLEVNLEEERRFEAVHTSILLTRQFPAFWSTGRIIRRPPWGRVKLAPIHSVSSWRFSKFSAWLCAGATIVRGLSEFRSVSLRFVPFVWLFDRWSEVSCCLRVICVVEVRVLSLVWLFAGSSDFW